MMAKTNEYPPQFLRNFDAQAEGFKAFLEWNGAVIQPPTSEWEVLRFEHGPGATIIYRDKYDSLTWSPSAKDAWRRYAKGEPLPAKEKVDGLSKSARRLEAVVARDGVGCFYCGQSDVKLTVEHLVAVMHGGTNHLSNLVGACQECNNEAGCKFVVDKIKLREHKRAALKSAREITLDWLPIAGYALPEPVRKYIHDLETNADPAGMVRENVLLHDENAALRRCLAQMQNAAADIASRTETLNEPPICTTEEIEEARQ